MHMIALKIKINTKKLLDRNLSKTINKQRKRKQKTEEKKNNINHIFYTYHRMSSPCACE